MRGGGRPEGRKGKGQITLGKLPFRRPLPPGRLIRGAQGSFGRGRGPKWGRGKSLPTWRGGGGWDLLPTGRRRPNNNKLSWAHVVAN